MQSGLSSKYKLLQVDQAGEGIGEYRMNVGAVFGRELRTSARSAFTYYLRAVGVAALLGACLFYGLEHGFAPAMGSPLFGSLHRTLFFAIWLVVPILTADCISRERREGTLGLLFLTGLTGSEIVLAKGLVHGVRAFTLLASIIPVLAIPFLLGGLTWPEIAVSSLINVAALCRAGAGPGVPA